MKPNFPLISIYKDQALYIYKNDETLRTISTFTFLKQNPDECKFYDRNGNKWTLIFVNDQVKDTFLTKLLANTFHNPTIKVDLKWALNDKYTIESFKADLINAVDNDKNDLIAQFEDADTIKSRFKKCSSFDEILESIKTLVLPSLADM